MSNGVISLRFGRSEARALRVLLVFALIVSQFAMVLPGAMPARAAGSSYSLDWVVADPEINNNSVLPTYTRRQPNQQACPAPSGGLGRAPDPMANAVYGNPRDAVQTLAPSDLALGQIVPFEVKIAVNGSTSTEGGIIEFTSSWATKTTPGDNFGYDPTYGLYCAFVDVADTAFVETVQPARVASFTSTILNPGTANEKIQGTIRVMGLDSGDTAIVEMWVVLKKIIPTGSSGNVQAGIDSGRTITGETINVGNQTVSLLRAQEFFTSDADVSITKSDSPDPVGRLDPLNYTLLVKNNSPADSTGVVANDIVVTDTLDLNTTFVSTSVSPASGASCTVSGGTIRCEVGSLSPQQSVTIQIGVSVKNTAPTAGTVKTGPCTVGAAGVDLCNRASLTMITDDPTPANNDASEPTDVILINHAPVANNDSATTNEDTAVTISVLANDTDPDGHTLQVGSVTQPTNGTVVINANGTVTYTPNANFNGTNTFTYQACDNGSPILCATATVTVTVNSVNDVPVAVDDNYVTNEDTLLNIAAPGVLANDSDADSDTLTVSLVPATGPTHGTLTQNANGSFTYTPAANYNGTDAYRYRVCDPSNACAEATVRITVDSVNDRPVAANDAYTVGEDTPLTVAAPGVLANDTDVDGGTLSATLLSGTGPAHGSVAVNANGSFTYTPNNNFNGTDSFKYEVCDSGSLCDTGTVTITVTAVNDPPEAVDDDVNTSEDVPVVVLVLANDDDVDGDSLTVTSVSDPAHGTAATNGTTVTYTPDLNYNGPDSFTYTISDGDGGISTATVTVGVASVNDPPVAADDVTTTPEDTEVTVNVMTNDTDVDGNLDPNIADSVKLIINPEHGSAVVNPDNSITYTPDPNFNGPDQLTYEVCDIDGACDTAVLRITVTPVNDAPVANDDSYSTNEDSALTVPAPGVLENDGDVDGDILVVSSNGQPSHGSVTVNADGSFSYTPALNYNGPDSFIYTISDGHGGTHFTTVNLKVVPVNDAPDAVNNSYNINEDTTLNVSAPGVLGNDSDVDGDALTVSNFDLPDHGTVQVDPDGSFSYTPAANYNGPDSFTYTVSDGHGGTDTATVSITVNPVNDAPVANVDNATTDEDVAVTIDVLANDNDVDDNLDPTTLSINSNPANGTVALTADHKIRYTPNPNFYSDDSFVYQVCDTNGLCDDATVNLVVNSVNDVPMAEGDTYSTNEDMPRTIAAPGVLANDSDADGDTLTVTKLSGPAHGELSQNSDGSFTYSPDLNFNGTDSYTYKACDPSNACTATTTVTITVDPVNDEPVARDDTATTDEDTAVAISVLANDTDVDSNPLHVGSVTQPQHGTVAINPGGTSVTYTPNANYFGEDSFKYDVCDNGSPALCDTATVTITVNPVNDAPDAVDDTYSTDEDTALTVNAPLGVLSNDEDVDDATLTATIATPPSHGIVTLNANGSFTYTPVGNFNGEDSFTYTASDGHGGTDTATVSIAVIAVNDTPVANNDTATTAEDTQISIPVLSNDTDADGDTLTVGTCSGASHGTVVVNGNQCVYTPDPDYNGPDSFTYTACDSGGACDPATVNVTVTSVNDAPVAKDDSDTTPEDMPVTVHVLDNDTDVEDDSLTVTSVTQPEHGTASFNATTVTYTPALDYHGPDSFTYRVSDGHGGTDTATVTIGVASVNDAPSAVNDTSTTAEDTAVTISVLTNDTDVDGDTLHVGSVTQPDNGTVVINGNGTITYTPDANFYGTDTFTYTVCDNGSPAMCDTATVTVTVTPVNDAPVAVNDSYSTNEDTLLTIPTPGVLGNDTDVDGDPLTVSSHTNPAHGTLTLNANGSFTYDPATNYNGPDSFTYTVSDGHGGTRTATVNITVDPVNDDPVARDDAATTNEDTAVTFNVLSNDTDIDSDTLRVGSVTQPTHGAVVINGNGTVTYTPSANFHGTDSFTYEACDRNPDDPDKLCDTGTVTLTINSVNDAPSAVNDTYGTNEDTPLTVAAPGVLENDADVDDATLTVSGSTPPAHGSVVQHPDGSFTYTPAANFHGTDTYTYTASDGHGGTDTATVTISVTSVNDAPNANNDTATTAEDTVVTISVLSNDTDADGDTLTVESCSDASYGTVELDGNQCVYTPAPNYNGPDSFTYVVSDGHEGTSTGTVTITVTPVNDAPVAVDDAYTTNEDTALTVASPGVLDNDVNVDDDMLSVTGNTQPSHGSVTVSANGSFTYTPTGNFHGTDTFNYTVCDPSNLCDTGKVTITVNPMNDPPVAHNDSYNGNEGAVLTVNETNGVLANDTDLDGDTLTASILAQPSHGSVTLNADGSFTYTPNVSFSGTDTFTYAASDGHGGTSTATVTIVVRDVRPSLTVTKTANQTSVIFLGGLVTYTVVVKNTSSEPITLASLVDDKFGNLDNDTQAAHTWTTSSCAVPRTLDRDATYTCTFTANLTGTAGGTHVNTITGTVTDNEGNSVTSTGSDTVTFHWRGRTPGYWKNHPTEWPAFQMNGVAVSPSTRVSSVFAIPSGLLTNGKVDLNGDGVHDTLMDALNYKGGSDVKGATQILLRAAVSGLLNEQLFGASYPAYSTVGQLVTAVNTALASLNRITITNLATTIDNWNNGVH